MLPQAPFEPTYRIWNFNTMPLFPILIGLARTVGITGSHSLKLLPLFGWLAGILFALRAFRHAGAKPFFLLAAAAVLTFDPILRWSSVLVRPESLIAAMGVVILFGFRFGWPNFLRERKYFHPVSLCLLIGALLHFNAIHLVPVVIVLYAGNFRKILKIGALTGIGLVPWLLTIAAKPRLFVEQMELQFGRLTGFHNPWLSSWQSFTTALLQDMGSPEPWASEYHFAILGCVFATPLFVFAMVFSLRGKDSSGAPRWVSRDGTTLVGAFVWLLSALYLWHTKAEVWFTHFVHLAFWCWTLLVIHDLRANERLKRVATLIPAIIGLLFLYGQIGQTLRLEATNTWHWRNYDEWIDCIDRFLVEEHVKRGRPIVFRVWDPTFPDITIELSRRHPEWDFTRTNDFHQRRDLAVRHGHDVDAMVVTEIFRPDEVVFRGKLSERPNHRSVWMGWREYFLNTLERDPTFKPNRYLCQNGRWDAFIYFKE